MVNVCTVPLIFLRTTTVAILVLPSCLFPMKLKRRQIKLILIVLFLCLIYSYVQLQGLLQTSAPPQHRHGVTEFRRRRIPHHKWNVSTPVLILSLPKSGTTSLARYFICGGIPTAHTHRFWNGTWLRLGDCFRQNVLDRQHRRPMLDGCGPYKVWADLVRKQKTKGLMRILFPFCVSLI